MSLKPRAVAVISEALGESQETLALRSSCRGLSAFCKMGKIASTCFPLQDSSRKTSFSSPERRHREGFKVVPSQRIQAWLSEKSNWIFSLKASSLEPGGRKQQGISGKRKNLEWIAVPSSQNPFPLLASGRRSPSRNQTL